jgi:hypothetical protein
MPAGRRILNPFALVFSSLLDPLLGQLNTWSKHAGECSMKALLISTFYISFQFAIS